MRRSALLLVTSLASSTLAWLTLVPGAESQQATSIATKERKPGVRVGESILPFQAKVFEWTGELETVRDLHSNRIGKPAVYVFFQEACSYCKLYRDRIHALAKSYRSKGVDFFLVNPMTQVPVEKRKAYHRKSGFPCGLIVDTDASIAKSLKITKTPEVLVVAADNEIVFRGGIDDNPEEPDQVKHRYLANAMEELLAGKAVSVKSSTLFG